MDAGELGVYFRAITGPDIVGGMSGESETRLRSDGVQLFSLESE
jgi:hypothetical protein